MGHGGNPQIDSGLLNLGISIELECYHVRLDDFLVLLESDYPKDLQSKFYALATKKSKLCSQVVIFTNNCPQYELFYN